MTLYSMSCIVCPAGWKPGEMAVSYLYTCMYLQLHIVLSDIVKPLIKDTPKEDKPPNKGQAESTLYRKSRLKEDNLSTEDKMAGPEGVLIKRFHCSLTCVGGP